MLTKGKMLNVEGYFNFFFPQGSTCLKPALHSSKGDDLLYYFS